jgi:hypothetical protein
VARLTIFANQSLIPVLLQTLLKPDHSVDPRELQRILPNLRAKVRDETAQSLVITLRSKDAAGKDFRHLQIAHILSDRYVVGAPEFDKIHTTIPDDLHDLAAQETQQGLEVVSCERQHIKEEDELGEGGPDTDEGQSAIFPSQLLALLKEIME